MNDDSTAQLARMLWVWARYRNAPASINISDYLTEDVEYLSKHFRAEGREGVLALLARFYSSGKHGAIVHIGKMFYTERAPAPCCYCLDSTGIVTGVHFLYLSESGLIAKISSPPAHHYLTREGGIYDNLVDHMPLRLR